MFLCVDLSDEGIKYLDITISTPAFLYYHMSLLRWDVEKATLGRWKMAKLTEMGRFTVQHTAKLMTWSVCIMMFSMVMVLVCVKSRGIKCFVLISVTLLSPKPGTVGMNLVVYEMAKKQEK